jgi:MoxR-like ATPase
VTDKDAARARAEAFRARFGALEGEVQRQVIGQRDVIRDVLIALFAGGHVLLEGVPGIGKTLLVRTVAQALDASFSRIQFTPDLMPADVLGTRVVVEDEKTQKRAFVFEPGPIFASVVLADEINRATPKTQSALLEAMQEHAVTTAGERRRLPEPFFVLATQNPIEMEGTYPLPEAQLDRFFAKVLVPTPGREDLEAIARATTGVPPQPVPRVATAAEVTEAIALVREVPLAPHVERHAVDVVLATQPGNPSAPESIRRYVRYGASPRGVQALVLGAKVRALATGRFAATVDDVRAQAKTALRHRLILSFDGEADGVAPDKLVDDVLASVRVPALEKAEA